MISYSFAFASLASRYCHGHQFLGWLQNFTNIIWIYSLELITVSGYSRMLFHYGQAWGIVLPTPKPPGKVRKQSKGSRKHSLSSPSTSIPFDTFLSLPPPFSLPLSTSPPLNPPFDYPRPLSLQANPHILVFGKAQSKGFSLSNINMTFKHQPIKILMIDNQRNSGLPKGEEI